jgi:hypothetical protein
MMSLAVLWPSTLLKTELVMKTSSILQWYRVLRGHYHWTAFQAVRYALWLAR